MLPQHSDERFGKRFLREARVLAELKHPNIVEVYDFDVNRWQAPCYVMEYLPGSTLRDVVRGRGKLAADEVLSLLREVAAGLSFAHRRGVVHRDLKPASLFLAAFDQRTVCKILDFGIAEQTRSGEEGATDLTRSGAVVGTLGYLAPEQIRGEPVQPCTDQYALALIVAELLSGRAVRAGKTMGEICSDEIKRPLAVDQVLPSEISGHVSTPWASSWTAASAW